MNLITIYDTNGQELDMMALGLTGLKLRIPSPSYETVTQKIDGHSGVIVVDRILQQRNLVAEFVSKANGYIESLALRDHLYNVLGNGRVLYISESSVPMKRWKVYLDGWTPERINVKFHKFEIPLLAWSGTSESTSIFRKKFTTSNFRFKNEGDVVINPRLHSHSETEIEFSGVSSNLVIKNLTTGDEWSWTGTTITGDKIVLKGVRSLKNGSSIFGQTNKKLITLAPGWNSFEIIGTTDGAFEINIRTRFYFL